MTFMFETRVFPVILLLSVLKCVTLSLEHPLDVTSSLDHPQSQAQVTAYTSQYKSLEDTYNYTQYQPYPKIVKELKRIAKTKDKLLQRKLFSIGETFENRTLWAIKFHEVSENNDKASKKIIVIDCGAHAREWIAPSTCMYLINELVQSKSSLRQVLKKYDWVIIPSLNPDGYTYSWKDANTRLWRKNRSYNKEQIKKYKETGNPLCLGVDINRNFNKVWGGPGSPKDDPCNEMYPGSKPFSETESSGLAKYLRSVKDDLLAYASLHGYGQFWLTPWGFTAKRPDQYKEMKRVAKLAINEMKNNSGVTYTVGPSHDQLYPNSGSSKDWVYSNLPTPYTYTIEMRPKVTSPTAFMMPPSGMVENAKDIAVGLLAMAMNIKEEKTGP